MTLNLNNWLNIITLIVMGVVGFYVVKSKVKDQNLKDLKDRVDILEKERDEARTQHLENQKAIANLEGQLKTYKEIPLKQIATSLSELYTSNSRILAVLQNTTSEQHIDTQLVDRQIVK